MLQVTLSYRSWDKPRPDMGHLARMQTIFIVENIAFWTLYLSDAEFSSVLKCCKSPVKKHLNRVQLLVQSTRKEERVRGTYYLYY